MYVLFCLFSFFYLNAASVGPNFPIPTICRTNQKRVRIHLHAPHIMCFLNVSFANALLYNSRMSAVQRNINNVFQCTHREGSVPIFFYVYKVNLVLSSSIHKYIHKYKTRSSVRFKKIVFFVAKKKRQNDDTERWGLLKRYENKAML